MNNQRKKAQNQMRDDQQPLDNRSGYEFRQKKEKRSQSRTAHGKNSMDNRSRFEFHQKKERHPQSGVAYHQNSPDNRSKNEFHQKKEEPQPLRTVHDRKPSVNIIAGRNPVLEALRGGALIEKVVILTGVKGKIIEKIKNVARGHRIQVVEAGKQKFRHIVSDTTTQGVIAIVGTKQYVEIDTILDIAKERSEPPFILMLDEIEDPQNLGALIRTAECAGAHGAVIPKHHAASVNQTVAKTSAGASEHLPVAKVVNIASTIDELKQKGIWVVGTDSSASKLYTEIDYTKPVAIVIGNEGKGIRHLVKEKCDFMVKIPLLGKIGSLNASVSGALIMYEVVRSRKMTYAQAKSEQLINDTNSDSESL
jgi:23S rRNA (guanosine2251-2'-O)-methyltransferase